MTFTKEKLLEGLRCETCSENRVFGEVPNSEPDNLYVYIDLSGKTRCFCKKHMTRTKNGGDIMGTYENNDRVCYGAVLLSEVLKDEN